MLATTTTILCSDNTEETSKEMQTEEQNTEETQQELSKANEKNQALERQLADAETKLAKAEQRAIIAERKFASAKEDLKDAKEILASEDDLRNRIIDCQMKENWLEIRANEINQKFATVNKVEQELAEVQKKLTEEKRKAIVAKVNEENALQMQNHWLGKWEELNHKTHEQESLCNRQKQENENLQKELTQAKLKSEQELKVEREKLQKELKVKREKLEEFEEGLKEKEKKLNKQEEYCQTQIQNLETLKELKEISYLELRQVQIDLEYKAKYNEELQEELVQKRKENKSLQEQLLNLTEENKKNQRKTISNAQAIIDLKKNIVNTYRSHSYNVNSFKNDLWKKYKDIVGDANKDEFNTKAETIYSTLKEINLKSAEDLKVTLYDNIKAFMLFIVKCGISLGVLPLVELIKGESYFIKSNRECKMEVEKDIKSFTEFVKHPQSSAQPTL